MGWVRQKGRWNGAIARAVGLLLGAVVVLGRGWTQAQGVDKEIQGLRQERSFLQREFAGVVAQYRDAAPQERKQALEAWQRAHAAELAAIDKEIEGLLAARRAERPDRPLAATGPRPAPTGLSPKEKELWSLRDEVNRSRAAALQQVWEAAPEVRRRTMEAWEQSKTAHLARINALESEISAEREARQAAAPAREVVIPALPMEWSETEQAAWDEMWMLRYERIALLRQYRDATPQARRQVMEAWQRTRGVRLSQLEARFMGPRFERQVSN